MGSVGFTIYHAAFYEFLTSVAGLWIEYAIEYHATLLRMAVFGGAKTSKRTLAHSAFGGFSLYHSLEPLFSGRFWDMGVVGICERIPQDPRMV